MIFSIDLVEFRWNSSRYKNLIRKKYRNLNNDRKFNLQKNAQTLYQIFYRTSEHSGQLHMFKSKQTKNVIKLSNIWRSIKIPISINHHVFRWWHQWSESIFLIDTICVHKYIVYWLVCSQLQRLAICRQFHHSYSAHSMRICSDRWKLLLSTNFFIALKTELWFNGAVNI